MRVYVLFVAAIFLVSLSAGRSTRFSFAILGDRTGEAQAGVYEQVWRETAQENPKFVLSIGDTIQGYNDRTAVSEWKSIRGLLLPYKNIPLYLAPGNHDIWSRHSEELFQRFSGHPPHYSFDFEQIHVTVLDTSRSDTLSESEVRFLEDDLKAHAAQPVKIVMSHRPFWLVPVLFGASQTPVHQVLMRYGVQYVFTGHVHKIIHAKLDGITYLCMPSAGGHLRDTKKYEDGWFFGHTRVEAEGKHLLLRIEEVGPPHGKGRVTTPADWGISGLIQKAA